MKLLIIGATSYIGSRLVFDLADKYEIVGTYHTNNSVSPRFIQVDIREPELVERLLVDIRPEVIVHLANYSSSRQIKGNEINFPRLNLDATKIVVDSARKFKMPLIFFSSLAATTKLDYYGELKAKSEEIVRTTTQGYNIIRPSAVIGLSPVQTHNKLTDKILAVINGNSQEFDNSWVMQPTYIGHLSQVIDQIITQKIWNKELNIFTDFPITQYQMANDILSQFNLQAIPLDTGRKVPMAKVESLDLNLFHLKPISYKEIVDLIAKELKSPEKFCF